jgi:hypothetical protein
MLNIKLGKPLAQWTIQSTIAMFCFKLDRHCSFDTTFPQMRVRLLKNLEARVNKCDNEVQVAYTLACIEYMQSGTGPAFNLARPTEHVRCFVQLLRKKEELFEIRENVETNSSELRKISGRLAAMRWDPRWRFVDSDVVRCLEFIDGGLRRKRAARTRARRRR